MQVMDIVNRAALQSGVVPSFNPDEVPEDVQARGADILRFEIIPCINCDRQLDVTEVIHRACPKNGVVDLRTTPDNYRRRIYGSCPMTKAELLKVENVSYQGAEVPCLVNVRVLLDSYGITDGFGNNPTELNHTEYWDTDQFGNPRNIAVWTDDHFLVEIDSGHECDPDITKVNPLYNVPFTPMRVDEIYRECDGAALKYIHAGEFVSTEFRYAQLVFMTEDYPDRLRLRFGRNYSGEALVIRPVPVRIINQFDEPRPWEGELVAPEKFRSFITLTLAYRLAVEYGITSADAMDKLAAKAYNFLLKNPSKHEHPQDVTRKISEYLARGRGWRVGNTNSAYGGGFNG